MKKMVKVLVIVMVVCLIPSYCFAAAGWFTVTIGKTGVSNSGTFAYLTDTAATKAFTNNPFYLDSSGTNSKTMLAAALTAVSLGKTCYCYVSDTTAYANCSSFYLVP